jgi:hypothetical protein
MWSAAENLRNQQRTTAREEDRAEQRRAVKVARDALGAAIVEDALRRGKATSIELVVGKLKDDPAGGGLV